MQLLRDFLRRVRGNRQHLGGVAGPLAQEKVAGVGLHLGAENVDRNGAFGDGGRLGLLADEILAGQSLVGHHLGPEKLTQPLGSGDGIADGSLNIFEGPMKDNQGNTILKSGEVLDDGGLWAMNYYVEGVEGKIPN